MRPSQRAANVRYYERNRDHEGARVRVRQQANVEFLRELRARPCLDCGSTFDPHQMDFDHREGTEKAFRLTSGGAMLRSRTALLAEASKCDVVCANCHRIRTWRRHTARPASPPGTSVGLGQRRDRWRAQARLLDVLRDRPCADCSQRFPPCAMDFDHRDPTSKRSAVTRMIGRAGTQRILDEAAKCDIVCANCHRLRTFERRSAASARE
jgi:hypothetical protein